MPRNDKYSAFFNSVCVYGALVCPHTFQLILNTCLTLTLKNLSVFFSFNCVPLVKTVTFFGVPKTWQILNMVSTSLEPGNRGLRV